MGSVTRINRINAIRLECVTCGGNLFHIDVVESDPPFVNTVCANCGDVMEMEVDEYEFEVEDC